MNKVIVTIISIIVIIGAIFTAFIMVNSGKEENVKSEIAQEEIFDECTDEYELMQQDTLKTNSSQERTSPNCALITKIYYKGCKHTTNEYSNIPEELVNLNQEEIEEKYKDFSVQSFNPNEVVLYQEKEGECGEHYLVKDTRRYYNYI